VRATLLLSLVLSVGCKPSSDAQVPKAERFLGPGTICRGHSDYLRGDPEIVCIRGSRRYVCIVSDDDVACAPNPATLLEVP
jgi:hypothetical protein